MIEITEKMHSFRSASVHIWNTYLMPGNGVLRLDVEESFDVIEKELLKCMVFDGEISVDGYRKSPLAYLLVKAKSGSGEIPVLISRKDENNNTVWDDTGCHDFCFEDPVLFYDFFDWNHYGIIEYRFVRALSAASKRLLLIPTESCEFWFDSGWAAHLGAPHASDANV